MFKNQRKKKNNGVSSNFDIERALESFESLEKDPRNKEMRALFDHLWETTPKYHPDQHKWSFYTKKYRVLNGRLLMKYLSDQRKVTSLFGHTFFQKYYENGKSEILKEMKFLDFMKLKQIHLTSNNIVSLQSIHTINLPSLISLNLSINDITEVAPLKKVRWPLEYLYFDQNKVVSFRNIQEMPMKKLYLMIEREKSYQRAQDENLSWISKLDIQGIQAGSKRRIWKAPVKKAIAEQPRRMMKRLLLKKIKIRGPNELPYQFGRFEYSSDEDQDLID